MVTGRPDAPLGGLPAAPPRYDPLNPATVGPPPPLANALTNPAANPLARPLSPTSQFDSSIDQTLALGGGGNQLPTRPLIAPPPLTPGQVTAGQQRVNEILDPALEAAGDVPPALQSPLGTEAAPLTTPGERLQTGLATPQDPALQQALGPPRHWPPWPRTLLHVSVAAVLPLIPASLSPASHAGRG